MHGDNKHTLLPECQEQVEAEANYGAGRLLFLRDRFVIEARDLPIAINSVQSLHRGFGNTLSSTLWRFVESVGVDRPMIGIIIIAILTQAGGPAILIRRSRPAIASNRRDSQRGLAA